MKTRLTPILLLALCFSITAHQAQASTHDGDDGDDTESPYFELQNGAPGDFPLVSTEVKTTIAGIIADVEVIQTYRNTGSAPIEANYVFPASTRAAVYGLTMDVNGRLIDAKVKEKGEARQVYKDAVRAGKTASLLEQERPNVFQMHVGNILPGDTIKVILRYTETLDATDGEYAFVFPTVVGPRYLSGGDDAKQDAAWVGNPFLNEGQLAKETFGMSVQLNAGLPIQQAAVNTHKTVINYSGKNSANFQLHPSERNGSNRDFVLNYRLAGKAVESGILLYEGENEDDKFFLAMVQPPERITPTEIVPREFIFVVDVSGSMHGFPLDTTKSLMRDLFGRLSAQDRFNILLFAGGSDAFSRKSVSANPENIRDAIAFLTRRSSGGGTKLLPAMRHAFNFPREPGTSRSVVVITDGLVAVEEELFELVRHNLHQCNVYSFGIGSSVNRFVIEGLGRVGQGESFVVLRPDQAADTARRFREYIEAPVLTGVESQFQDFEAYDVIPASIPDLLAERPVLVYGKWRGKAAGSIRLTGTSGTGAWASRLPVRTEAVSADNRALKYLWARQRIGEIQDYYTLRGTDERKQAIINLGLSYNLLTQFTSFVAVDDVVRNTAGAAQQVTQPLPLPKGVSNKAKTHKSVPGTPEPETWMLMGVVACGALFQFIKRRRSRHV